MQLTESHAVVFVDETGHDRFHDPQHPVFGWAGCVMTATQYASVRAAWTEMKESRFPGVDVLHAADLHRPTQDQLGALGDFFRHQPFARFAAVVRADATLRIEAVRVVAGVAMKRIEDVIRHLSFSRVALIFEEGDGWTSKVERHFGGLQLFEDGARIPVDKFFMAKAYAEPGLEIADFIAHAVGGAARQDNLQRKDFRSVFDGPAKRSSFMQITDAQLRR